MLNDTLHVPYPSPRCVWWWLSAVLILLTLAGCRTAGPSNLTTGVTIAAPIATTPPADAPTTTPGRIAVLLPDDAPDSRWATRDQPALARCLVEAGAPHVLYSAGGDAATQVEQAAEAIGEGAKVLLLAHVNDDAGAAVIDLARREGIKVIDYDRLTTQGTGADLYVGFDPFESGRLMAESLAPFARALPVARRNVVVLSGPESSGAAALVGDGIRAVVEPYVSGGQWTLVADEVGGDDPAATTVRVVALLSGDAPVGAVFAADDTLAGSVAGAARQLGLPPVRLGGRGATAEALQRVLAGEQTLTLYEPVGPLTGAACQAALAMLSGDEVVALTNRFIDNGVEKVPFIRLAPIVVTEDNLFATVVADGFHSREAICAGEYAQYCPEE